MIREVTEDLEETDEDRLLEPMWTEGDDDEEALLDELIEAMVSPDEAAIEASEAIPKDIDPRSGRADEFTCRSCHLIVSRSCLADQERSICRDCTDS
jgi:Domain of unknown function (DUF4193)